MSKRDTDLSDELRFHIESQIQAAIQSGLSPEEARQQVLRLFGGVEQVKEECRDMRKMRYIENLLQDTRYGLRTLRRAPGFTAVAVLSLALGIGANTAIFSLIDRVLLRMLPVKSPDQLVRLVITGPAPFVGPNGHVGLFRYADFEEFRTRTRTLSGVFITPTINFNGSTVAVDGRSAPASVELISGSYFPTLGVDAIAGRAITPDDEDAPVAVMSYGYWKRRFGRDTSIVGKTAVINTAPFTIIGIAPPEFFGVEVGRSPDVYVPVHMVARLQPGTRLLKSSAWLQVFARLKTGVSTQQATAELNVLFQRRLQAFLVNAPPNVTPEQKRLFLSQRIVLEPGGNGVLSLRQQFSEPLLILMCIVGLVLLIACANIANLLLARAVARRREMAVRLAIGAGRGRLLRQQLTESALLSLIGGAFGLALSFGLCRVLVSLMAGGFGIARIALDVNPDLHILTFTVGVSLLTGILFGLVPALRASKVDVGVGMFMALKQPRGIFGQALVAGQVALSLLLLIGAGLFVRTLRNLETFDAGFDRDHVLLFSLSRPRDAKLYSQVLRHVEAISGVGSASLSVLTPIDGGSVIDLINVEGFKARTEEDKLICRNTISPRYFETIGTPLLLGREFTWQDIATSARVAIVNETTARFYFPHESPIGKRFAIEEDDARAGVFIVGMVRDSKYDKLRGNPPRLIYLPYSTQSPGNMNFEVRTAGDPASIIGAIRQEVARIDKTIAVNNVRTLAQQIDNSLTQERMVAQLSGCFGILALLLACIGLYGIMSYTVLRRTSEIGIRMALGARPENVLWLISREVLLLVLTGIAIGLPATLAVTRLISSRLFGLSPTDPLTLAAATIVMIAVALLAGYLPARRAARVNPVVALRYE